MRLRASAPIATSTTTTRLNSTLCYSCHQTDYAVPTTQLTLQLGFPTTCELCHGTSVWTDSTFNHNTTTFPLTGSHIRAAAPVHGLPRQQQLHHLADYCIGCHQSDYNSTTNPGHSAQQQFFPTTCQNCHNTTAWTGATFNHSQYTRSPPVTVTRITSAQPATPIPTIIRCSSVRDVTAATMRPTSVTRTFPAMSTTASIATNATRAVTAVDACGLLREGHSPAGKISGARWSASEC